MYKAFDLAWLVKPYPVEPTQKTPYLLSGVFFVVENKK